ncbi:MAG TPA: LysR substrate-binding domain-containing protein [Pseudolabrys sp.]|jgi:LysR family cyn operon transcriptional activator|nr:LysR substrate-binding domain-containing protein [Pseudolabrys sp.]
MELRHIRYFLAIADAGSFTKAADRLHVTQPTLSHQIKQLEHLVGTVLFERNTKEIELTAAGRMFKPYCERIVKEIEQSALAISELEGLMRGTLHMAVFHSYSHSMLPPILAEFALRYPGVHVTAQLVPRLDMERDLASATLDFAVAYIADDHEQIVAERLFDEELVLVVGSKHALAARKSMPMRDLASWPLVLLTPEFGVRQYVERYLAGNGLAPHVVLDMNAIEPILATIRNSELASVLAAGAIVDPTGLHIVRLTNPVPKRSVGILWRRHGHRSAAALRMATMIKSAYANTSGLSAGGQRSRAHR